METNLLYLESDTVDHNSPAITRKRYIKSRRRTAQFQTAARGGGGFNSRKQSGELKQEMRNFKNIYTEKEKHGVLTNDKLRNMIRTF